MPDMPERVIGNRVSFNLFVYKSINLSIYLYLLNVCICIYRRVSSVKVGALLCVSRCEAQVTRATVLGLAPPRHHPPPPAAATSTLNILRPKLLIGN